MKIVLKQGESLEIEIDGEDTFRIVYGSCKLEVKSTLKDDKGRVGTIYSNRFAWTPAKERKIPYNVGLNCSDCGVSVGSAHFPTCTNISSQLHKG